MTRAHQGLIQERTRHMLRLRSALRDYFPAALVAYQQGTLTLTGSDVLALLAKAPTPAAAANLTTAQITALITRTTIRVENSHFRKLNAMLATNTPMKTRITIPQNDGFGLGGDSGMAPV